MAWASFRQRRMMPWWPGLWLQARRQRFGRWHSSRFLAWFDKESRRSGFECDFLVVLLEYGSFSRLRTPSSAKVEVKLTYHPSVVNDRDKHRKTQGFSEWRNSRDCCRRSCFIFIGRYLGAFLRLPHAVVPRWRWLICTSKWSSA